MSTNTNFFRFLFMFFFSRKLCKISDQETETTKKAGDLFCVLNYYYVHEYCQYIKLPSAFRLSWAHIHTVFWENFFFSCYLFVFFFLARTMYPFWYTWPCDIETVCSCYCHRWIGKRKFNKQSLSTTDSYQSGLHWLSLEWILPSLLNLLWVALWWKNYFSRLKLKWRYTWR